MKRLLIGIALLLVLDAVVFGILLISDPVDRDTEISEPGLYWLAQQARISEVELNTHEDILFLRICDPTCAPGAGKVVYGAQLRMPSSGYRAAHIIEAVKAAGAKVQYDRQSGALRGAIAKAVVPTTWATALIGIVLLLISQARGKPYQSESPIKVAP